MLKRDYGDMVAGVILIVTGLSVAIYALSSYNLGTVQRMGPAMFPVGTGSLLALFGLILLGSAFFRPGVMPEIRVFSPLFVLGGVAAFAFLIRPFGLIPAVTGLVFISSLAELKIQPTRLAGLIIALCFLAWIIFRVGIGLPIPLISWPF